jgi:acetyl esterase
VRHRILRAAARVALANKTFVRGLARPRSHGIDAELDPQIAAIVEFQRRAKLPPLESMEPGAARRYAAGGLAPLDLSLAPMAQITDATPGGVPVRIYVPRNAGRDWLVYFHGGGGVIGSIDSSEPFARHVAAKTGCTVASVEYRLGPEYKHPIAIEDAVAAYAGLVDRISGKVAVGGDSFGGFLSVHVDRLARQRLIRPPDAELLIYPVLDFTLTSPSIDRYANGYLLTRGMMHWFRDHYMHATDDYRAASPWFWADLSDLSPTIIATAGYDPLVDEGDAWVLRLRQAGVPVKHRRYGSLVHGFISMGGAVRAARSATDELCADLAELLRS